MKNHDFSEMENTIGGIECGEIYAVMDYLEIHNPAQYLANCGWSIECTMGGIYGSMRYC